MSPFTPKPIRSALGAIILFATLGSPACRAQKDAFFAKVYPCDATSMTASCGTTKTGAPMKCFSASQLGGSDFCAETCDPSHPTAARAGFTCVQAGALLQDCQPTASKTDPSVGCPEGLSCFRTSLGVVDQGLCLAMEVCANNADCSSGSIRHTCAGSLLRSALSSEVAAVLQTDNLQCLQTGCGTKTGCAPGTSCFGSVLAFGPPFDDVCVPNCDNNQPCPPGYVCLQNRIASPGGPAICVPGTPGSRCFHPEDCLLGECTDVGVEFNVCSLPCTSTEQCAGLNFASDPFVCAGAPSGHCVTARPFDGSNCVEDRDCSSGQLCFTFSPFGLLTHGECRVPCDADGKCPSRGGLPHVCLGENHDGGCFPSGFGIPCADASDCLPTFTCAKVDPDPRSRVNFSPNICTFPCASDRECDDNPLTRRIGFCGDGGVCRAAGDIGEVCDRDAQCFTRRCDVGKRMCVAAPHI